MRTVTFILMSFFCIAGISNIGPALAGEQKVTETLTAEPGLCREVAELAKKYDAEKKLPESVIVEGKSCPKGEVAQCFLSIMEKVLEKCKKEGPDAVPREDLDRIAVVHDSLQNELAGYEGYLVRREEIQRILAAPEVPPFVLKAGVNGFLRGEGTQNFRFPDFSFNPGHGEGRFLYRVKPYVYWHPTDYLDIHAVGQGYGYSGGSQYYGKYSLYQGFVEGKPPAMNQVALKLGRQDFSYGSTFILGPDSFYDGLSFDAARLRVQPIEPLSIDLLGGWYATPFSDGLKGYLAGAYATYTFSDGNAVEMYAFRDTGSEDPHGGEHLDIWGIRGTAKLGLFALQIEPVYESGKLFNGVSGNDSISACGGHADLSCELAISGLKNVFFAGYALGSGDRAAANQTRFSREFRNPDNDTSLVGDMNVIGDFSGITVGDHHASGLHDFTLGWGIHITKNLNFTATGHYFLAYAVEDGFSRGVGLETDFTLAYALSDNITILMAYDRFFTGGFFRDATGGDTGDIQYGWAMLQFNLDKTWLKRKKI